MNLHEQARAEAEREYPPAPIAFRGLTYPADAMRESRVGAYARGFLAGHEAATRTRVATGPSMDIVTHGVLGDWGKTHAVVDALIDAGYGSKPHTRVVTTATELDALPEATVLLDRHNDPWQQSDAGWHSPNPFLPHAWSSERLLQLAPLTVLYEPEEGR